VGLSPIFEFSGTKCSLEKLTKEVLRELNEAYLTKYVKQEPAYNPLDILRTDDNLEFEKKIAWLLSQPEYFAFLCKHVFNVDILPKDEFSLPVVLALKAAFPKAEFAKPVVLSYILNCPIAVL
jgi:hypothetical protein